jgi:hypothetical protein
MVMHVDAIGRLAEAASTTRLHNVQSDVLAHDDGLFESAAISWTGRMS